MAESKSASASAATATDQKRVITIVTTRGEKVKLHYDGAGWKDLKKILQSGGKDINGNSFQAYDLTNMKAMESVKNTTLEHEKAVVPEGNFNLFLMQVKSKLGGGANMNRSDINAAIKAFIEKDGDKAKDYFGNYSQTRSKDLVELIEKYKPGSKALAPKHKSSAIADVVKSVADSKDKDTDLYEEVSRMSMDDKLFLVIKLLTDIKDALPKQQSESMATAKVADKAVDNRKENGNESEADKKAREQREEDARKKKREEDEENERLDKEMSDLMEGVDDVDKNKRRKLR